MKALVLGATGMLGNAMVRVLAACKDIEVYGTARHEGARSFFPGLPPERIIPGVEVEKHDPLVGVFARVHPDVVINCIGLVKQLAKSSNPLYAIPLNTMLPHRLAMLCEATNARLVHISTDCVFSGARGNYVETDTPDADDLYGRSKLLGEVDAPHVVTIRTSIVGHELAGQNSLLSWFLAQSGSIKGYTQAFFTGLPTTELSRVVADYILPRPDLHGIYHVAGRPINKYDLLTHVGKIYGKNIEIVPDNHLVIDRTLNADKFNKAVGYQPPEWPQLLAELHQFYQAQRR